MSQNAYISFNANVGVQTNNTARNAIVGLYANTGLDKTPTLTSQAVYMVLQSNIGGIEPLQRTAFAAVEAHIIPGDPDWWPRITWIE